MARRKSYLPADRLLRKTVVTSRGRRRGLRHASRRPVDEACSSAHGPEIWAKAFSKRGVCVLGAAACQKSRSPMPDPTLAATEQLAAPLELALRMMATVIRGLIPMSPGTTPALAAVGTRTPAEARRPSTIHAARGETEDFAIVVKPPTTIHARTTRPAACKDLLYHHNVEAYRTMYQVVMTRPTGPGRHAVRDCKPSQEKISHSRVTPYRAFWPG